MRKGPAQGQELLRERARAQQYVQPHFGESFLESGGRVAWGAVPTDGPVSDDVGLLWRRLVGAWCDLVRAGCDPVLLRSRSLVTPACGLAGHGLSQADLALRLARELGQRAHDQAVASRLAVGG